MTDNWINEAFKNANVRAEMGEKIAHIVSGHLDKKTNELLNNWATVIGDRVVAKILLAMTDDGVENAIMELSTHFFVGGYLSALDDVKAHKIEI